QPLWDATERGKAEMTEAQTKFTIALLVASGLALCYRMLDWTSQFQHESWTPVIILYEDLDPLSHVARWGLYTRHGEIGVIFGVIVPLCLFAAAIYLALALRLRDR